MWDIFFFVISMGILPMLINKTTEGRFDWIKPRLPIAWMVILTFYSLYLLGRPPLIEIAMKLHKMTLSGIAGYLIVGFLGALVFCGYWWFVSKMFPKPNAQSPNKEASQLAAINLKDIRPPMNIVLYHAVGGAEDGVTYPTKDSWYWLMWPLTVVNAGTVDETVAFELYVPTNRNSSSMQIFTPLILSQAPQNCKLPPDIRLLGVEEIRAGKSVTGSLLFKLDRNRIQGEAQAMNLSKSVVPDFPDVIAANIVVNSLVSGAQQSFHAFSLIKR